MPDSSVAGWFALAGSLGGFIMSGINDWWKDHRNERWDAMKRGEQRDYDAAATRTEFQRRTLLELQEVAMRLMRTAAQANHADKMAASQNNSQWTLPQLPADISDEAREAQARTTILVARCRDEQVRYFAGALKSHCAAIAVAGTEQTRDARLAAASKAFSSLNECIGCLLREMHAP
jgi:hypothetical protein